MGAVEEKWQKYAATVAAACPDLTIESAGAFHSGQRNDLLLVNEELLFRFARYDEGVEALRRERAFLQAVRPHLPFATPHYVYRNLDGAGVGSAFLGFRKLAGESLWREELSRIKDEAAIDLLARDLSTFLRALHSVRPHAAGLALQPADTLAGWREIFARIRQVVFPRLTAEARAWTTVAFTRFVDGAESFAFDTVPRHGDVGASNLLFDARKGRLAGVIDFGCAGLGDPAIDFAGLSVSYGKQFLQRCARHYPLIEQCRDRIRFYAECAFLLEDALFCIEHGAAEADGVVDQVNRAAVAQGR